MDPDEYMQANIPLDGSYEGIGAWVDPDAEYLTIVSPMPNSPAEKAGLKPGDEVIAVDGENMTGVDGNLVIRRVLGPAGTTVILTIRREGEQDLLEFEITREEISMSSVNGEMLEEGIAYVQLLSFADRTSRDLRRTLETLLAQNPIGLILDLRFNGGGFLPTAIEVASEFISEGMIMTEQFGDETEQVYEAISGGVATEIPLIVLINGGTASASEIVAGAIQDYGRGLLIGETTFGKGSVQSWIPLSDDGGAIRVTIARWYTPLDRQIHELGLTPDIEVLLTDEDIEANLDVQLDKAIELLTESK
jgi:carboxyl-terminal processing protease